MQENKTKERSYVVYKHTSPSKKVYIGLTGMNPPEKRWGKTGCGYKRNKHFWSAIEKYGWDNFEHEILFENLSKEEAEKTEIRLIAEYKSTDGNFGYNVQKGGNAQTDETLEKLSQIRKNMSEETRRKMSESRKGDKNYNYGKKMSYETRIKLSTAHKGKKLSPEHIEKIRENSKKQYTEELKNKLIDINSIEISQYNANGEFIRNWKSAAEAERETGICGISSCCTGNRKMAGGYIWKHSDEPLTKEYVAWCNDNRNYGRMVSVCQYDMYGMLLKIYEGQIEAELETGINRASINNCCNKISRTAGNYIWRYANEPLTEEDIKWCNEKGWDKEKKAVVQFSLDLVPLKYFNGISNVRDEFGYDSSTIVKCCKGKKEKAYGYIWKYASDVPDAVELLLYDITTPLSPATLQETA